MDSGSIQRIAAGQAITDLASCVKELLDNALDAGSSKINSCVDTNLSCAACFLNLTPLFCDSSFVQSRIGYS